MGKGKKPGKHKNPTENEDSAKNEEVERQTQEKAALVPPPRRPPTAVGAGTPPRPEHPSHSAPTPHRRPALFQLLQTLRAVAGAILDLADAAADAITKGIRRGA